MKTAFPPLLKKELAELYGVDPRTITNWLRAHPQLEYLCPPKKKTDRYKNIRSNLLTPNEVNLVVEIIGPFKNPEYLLQLINLDRNA